MRIRVVRRWFWRRFGGKSPLNRILLATWLLTISGDTATSVPG